MFIAKALYVETPYEKFKGMPANEAGLGMEGTRRRGA